MYGSIEKPWINSLDTAKRKQLKELKPIKIIICELTRSRIEQYIY